MKNIKSDMNIEIRLANENDLVKNNIEIVKLLEDNYHLNFPNKGNLHQYAKSSYNDMLEFFKSGSAMIVGAFSCENIIGFLWAYERLLLGESRLHINHIVVNSNYRGFGIGTEIIQFIEELAIKNNNIAIDLLTTCTNVSTICFYRKLGYNPTRIQFEKKMGDKDDNRKKSN